MLREAKMNLTKRKEKNEVNKNWLKSVNNTAVQLILLISYGY